MVKTLTVEIAQNEVEAVKGATNLLIELAEVVKKNEEGNGANLKFAGLDLELFEEMLSYLNSTSKDLLDYFKASEAIKE